jgi:hypothetical protein
MANGAATPSGRVQRGGKIIGKINISIEKFDSVLKTLRITEPHQIYSVNNFLV